MTKRVRLSTRVRGGGQRHECGLCGKPEARGNLVICRVCEELTRARLAEQPAFLRDLRAEMAREVSRFEQEGGKSAQTPLPFSDRAARLIRSQRNLFARYEGNRLVGWVPELAAAGPIPAPPGPFHARCQHESCLRLRSHHYPADTIREMAAFVGTYLFRWRTSENLTRLAVDLAALNFWMLDALQAQKASRTVGPCPNKTPEGDEWCAGTVTLTRWLDESKKVEAKCSVCQQAWDSVSFSGLGRGIDRRKAAEIAARREAEEAKERAQAFIGKGSAA